MKRFTVILPAAGSSTRFQGTGTKKPFADLGGLPVWQRTVRAFTERPDVELMLLVVADSDRPAFESAMGSFENRVALVSGGATRAESVRNAFGVLPSTTQFVAIHDVARPLITASVIDRVFASAIATGAALPGIPVTSTVKQIDDTGRIVRTIDRSQLQLAQTPQTFSIAVLRDAYEKAGDRLPEFTDEASLVEAAGHPVTVVAGCPDNIKITTAADLRFAEAILARV